MSSPEQAEPPRRNYQDAVRRVAGRWVAGLERTSITPDGLTIAGVGLCLAGAVAGVAAGAAARRGRGFLRLLLIGGPEPLG